MFAYTDCIPQVRDELIKSIFPRSWQSSHWHPQVTKGTATVLLLLLLGQGLFFGLSQSPAKAEVTELCHCSWHLNCWNYRWPGGFLQKIGNASERLKLVHSSSLGNVVESISFTVLEGILAWSHWVSKCQCLQYCRIWAGNQPRRVTFLHDNSFSNCWHVQQGRLDDCGRLFTDLSACIFLLNLLTQADTVSWGLGVCLVFCVHVFCLLLVLVFCFSQVPSPLLLTFFSALVRLELRKPVLPKALW